MTKIPILLSLLVLVSCGDNLGKINIKSPNYGGKDTGSTTLGDSNVHYAEVLNGHQHEMPASYLVVPPLGGQNSISNPSLGSTSAITPSGTGLPANGTPTPLTVPSDLRYSNLFRVDLSGVFSSNITSCTIETLITESCVIVGNTFSGTIQHTSLAGQTNFKIVINGVETTATAEREMATRKLFDTNAGYAGNFKAGMAFNGSYYFSATFSGSSDKMFKIDPSGTITMAANTSGVGNSDSPTFHAVFNNEMFFSSVNTMGARKLFKIATDGTVTQVLNLRNDQSESEYVYGFHVHNSDLYFTYHDSVSSLERVAKMGTDGIAVPTFYIGGNTSTIGVHNGEMYVKAGINPSEWEGGKIFKLDVGGNWVQVSDTTGSTDGDDPDGLVAYNGKIYFSSRNGSMARKIYSLNSGGSITQISDMVDMNEDRFAGAIVFNGELHFIGMDDDYKISLFKITTSDEILRVSDMEVEGFKLWSVGSSLYFLGKNSGETKLMKLATNGAITLVSNLSDTSIGGIDGNDLYFSAEISAGIKKIFKVNDVTGIVHQVSGAFSGDEIALTPDYFAVINGNPVFAAKDSNGFVKAFTITESP